MVRVARRSARAILVDAEERLVLVKRTKLGMDPYWTTPGGGVESGDGSVEAALRRELAEELGACAEGFQQVFLASSTTEEGLSIQHFLVCRLTRLDTSERSGSEFDDPTRGGYELDRIDLAGDVLGKVDLKPLAVKEFVLANRDALLAEVAVMA